MCGLWEDGWWWETNITHFQFRIKVGQFVRSQRECVAYLAVQRKDLFHGTRRTEEVEHFCGQRTLRRSGLRPRRPVHIWCVRTIKKRKKIINLENLENYNSNLNLSNNIIIRESLEATSTPNECTGIVVSSHDSGWAKHAVWIHVYYTLSLCAYAQDRSVSAESSVRTECCNATNPWWSPLLASFQRQIIQ